MADRNSAEDDEKRRQNRFDALVEQQARIDAKLERVTPAHVSISIGQ